MKKIKYKMLGYMGQYNPETEEVEQVECLAEVERTYSETAEEIAKREAYNGEYTIEDDGQFEPESTPTQLDRVESQVAYLAMMTGYTDILEV